MNNNKIFEALHALPALSSSSSSSISWCVIIQVLCWDPLQLRRRRRTARVSLSFVASFASPWVVRWAPAESKAIGPMSRQTPPTSPLLLLCVFFFFSYPTTTWQWRMRFAEHTHTRRHCDRFLIFHSPPSVIDDDRYITKQKLKFNLSF